MSRAELAAEAEPNGDGGLYTSGASGGRLAASVIGCIVICPVSQPHELCSATPSAQVVTLLVSVLDSVSVDLIPTAAAEPQ